MRNEKTTPNSTMSRFALSFRDKEDSVRYCDGSEQIPVETCIAEFEENAAVMAWDNF